MPVYLNIDRLSHIVTIVAHGTLSDEDFRGTARDLIAANVSSCGKIIDNSASTTKEAAELADPGRPAAPAVHLAA